MAKEFQSPSFDADHVAYIDLKYYKSVKLGEEKFSECLAIEHAGIKNAIAQFKENVSLNFDKLIEDAYCVFSRFSFLNMADDFDLKPEEISCSDMNEK